MADNNTITYRASFEEFITLYRGVERVWMGDGTGTYDPGDGSGPSPDYGVVYAEYVDGQTQALGPTSAYYFAVRNGYTGTFAQWGELLQNASTYSQIASTKAQEAAQSATNAANSANTANQYKNEAAGWATGNTSGTWSATNNAKYYYEQAQHAVESSGYLAFEIDSDGYLVYTRDASLDIDFALDSDGYLVIESGDS